jgi:hypothetical protein
VKASANTPSGATHNIQPMIRSSASAIASSSPTSALRFGAAIREAAKAKRIANTTSGRTSPLPAAAITFSGTSARKNSPAPGTAPSDADPIPAAPARSASAAPPGSGKAAVSSWMAIIPKIADAVQTMTIHSTVRLAIRPPRAASALRAMPVTRSATTKGITVIFNASSHSSPTMLAVSISGPRAAGVRFPPRIPSRSPPSSAASTK